MATDQICENQPDQLNQRPIALLPALQPAGLPVELVVHVLQLFFQAEDLAKQGFVVYALKAPRVNAHSDSTNSAAYTATAANSSAAANATTATNAATAIHAASSSHAATSTYTVINTDSNCADAAVVIIVVQLILKLADDLQ